MYDYGLHQRLNNYLLGQGLQVTGGDNLFYTRFLANLAVIEQLYSEIYGQHTKGSQCFEELLHVLVRGHKERSERLRQRDVAKQEQGAWFCSNDICGMSLYVDRFAGTLTGMKTKLPYLQELGVNFLHLMPLFESPAGESDGGYAVSDFRKVDPRFGTLEDLRALQQQLQASGCYLMLDIVLNHTSHHHYWAQKAKEGDPRYLDYFYTYPDRQLPDQFEQTMPEIFPESAPGSFTWVPELNRWVMTVFHHYQWDLNYTNPEVFVAMVDTILFYANLGVDVLRIDAPAFIWKELGTTCQNRPGAHRLLRLIRQCVQVAAPGMALLGEAIVAPAEIMQYFGTGAFRARECDVAYNATHMALQWDALATGDTRVMREGQAPLLQKPKGTTWITYTRCHDDIGLGYDDHMIAAAGFNPYLHRRYLMEYFTGANGAPARGALFSVNPKTGDARISGTLASLCGLEAAVAEGSAGAVDAAIRKVILMQAHSFFLGGIPMLFYGDEVGYLNDTTYLQDPAKSYDNRWMHRPQIDWVKVERRNDAATVEGRIFAATRKLLQLRRALGAFADNSNIDWLTTHNVHVAGYLRKGQEQRLICLYNFSSQPAPLTWYALKEKGCYLGQHLLDHWSGHTYTVGSDAEHVDIPAYGFLVLELL